MQDHLSEVTDGALSWLQVNVLKLIATRVVPLIMASGIVTGALAYLQDIIGVDLPVEVVSAFVVTVMAGVIATAFAYVKNHGGAVLLGKTLLELEMLYRAGQEAVDQTPVEGADKPSSRSARVSSAPEAGPQPEGAVDKPTLKD
jgi:hypothetical protein